jgi:hypothetical protein
VTVVVLCSLVGVSYQSVMFCAFLDRADKKNLWFIRDQFIIGSLVSESSH